MNLRTQAREHKDPYIHDVKQEEMYSHGVGQETPPIAAQLVTQGKKVYTLTSVTGQWWLDKNDGTDPVVVSGNYDPDFRVRYLKVWGNSQSVDYANMSLRYDTPQSEGIVDYWAVGVMHKIWITRIDLDSRSTTAGVISLIG